MGPQSRSEHRKEYRLSQASKAGSAVCNEYPIPPLVTQHSTKTQQLINGAG